MSAVVKFTNTNYVIQTPIGSGSNVTIRSDNIVFDGNVLINGGTTQVESVNSTIHDNFITVNDGEFGNGVTLGTAGLTVDRGLAANVSLIWNEPLKSWQLTNNGTTYANVVTSNQAILKAVHDDPAPWLGGNLNLGGYTVFSNVGNLNFTGNLAISYSASAPGNIANTSIVYSQAPGYGGSGLYTSSSAGKDELITRTRAILYSIIL